VRVWIVPSFILLEGKEIRKIFIKKMRVGLRSGDSPAWTGAGP
jgi:hypothetical protein